MKYLFLILVLFIYITPLPSQTPLLASIEVRQKPTTPIKKVKHKAKKVKKKKFKRKGFKKPNQTQKTTADAKKVWLIILICQFGVIALLAFGFSIPLLQSLIPSIGIFMLSIGSLAFIITLIFVVLLILYNIKKKQREEPIKKSEEVLRAEVSNLSTQEIDRYLALNEELTSLRVSLKTILNNRSKERSRIKRLNMAYDIRNLDVEIAHIRRKIKNLRQQNDALKEEG